MSPTFIFSEGEEPNNQNPDHNPFLIQQNQLKGIKPENQP